MLNYPDGTKDLHRKDFFVHYTMKQKGLLARTFLQSRQYRSRVKHGGGAAAKADAVSLSTVIIPHLHHNCNSFQRKGGSMHKKIICFLFLLATLLWIGFIFGNSGDNGIESGNKSSHVQETVNQVIQNMGIHHQVSEHAIRKTAHFSEFALLALLLSADIFLLFGLLPAKALTLQIGAFLPAVPLSFFIAMMDELSQKLSSGRSCQFTDVLIDTAGAICSVVLITAVYQLVRKILRRRVQNIKRKSTVQ